ncbi:MAG: hypothetical protein AAB554_02125 [Patescibacteria group bacterium]
MSDAKKTSSFADKAATAAAIVGGAVAAAALIPQDELMKEGLPAFWDSVKGIARSGWLHANILAEKFHPIAFRWLSKLWFYVKLWLGVSLALIVAGIEVKTRFGSNFGHVLVAAGTVSFAGLGIMLYVLTDGIASLLYLKLKVTGFIFGKVTSLVGVNLPTVIDADDLAKFRNKVRMILAVATIFCFSLLFTMLFPAWSTLGWTICIWAVVGAIACGALHLNLEPGPAIRVVLYAAIVLLVGMTVIFIIDRLTGGALGFAEFQEQLLAINGSEILAAILVIVPATLLLMGVFAKDKDRKSAFQASAKYVGVGCAVLGAFLLYKGTISWEQLTSKEPPTVLTETADKAESAYLNALEGGQKSGTTSAPNGSASNRAVYAAPPSGPGPSAAPAARISPPRAKKPPLPPLKAKKYDDAAAAVDDLESLL